jgi:hypothetical protein
MFNLAATKAEIHQLIEEFSAIEPNQLPPCSQLANLSKIVREIEPNYCEDVAKLIFEISEKSEFDNPFSQVVLLSLVETMEFPDSRQAEGFHYWADKCSCQLVELGYYMFDETDSTEIDTFQTLLKSGLLSPFALISTFQSTIDSIFSETEIRDLLRSLDNQYICLGTLANTSIATQDHLAWVVENIRDFEFANLLCQIEEWPIDRMDWQYPFLQFSREDRVSDSTIEYLIKILEIGYEFANQNEKSLAQEFLEWEDQYGIPIEIFIDRAVTLAQANSHVLASAANCSLESLAEAVAVN